MKNVITLIRVAVCCILLCLATAGVTVNAQQPITSINTNNIVNSTVSDAAVKGAGLRSPSNSLVSTWDSLLTSYTINYNAPAAANTLRLSQFSVPGITPSLMTMPVGAFVKIRRAANPDVTDTRNIYNFWAQYSSAPGPLALSGTFNFTAPEVTNPEAAFLSNNLTSGYDNIFQNTSANPHYANIERVDFIIPGGLKCTNDTDRLQSGVAVIDRGTGDPFKIAAITAVDASNTPTAFGNLVSVTAANFGGNLLPANVTYGILINDPKFKSESRPSTMSNQNLRGVYISLADLGLAIGQRFYGYALFGPDVATANPDWTTYPTNTGSASELDPVNVMGLFRSPLSILPLPITFSATRINQSSSLSFTVYNEYNGKYVAIQRSADGVHFEDIDKLQVEATGVYKFTDNAPLPGNNYYRLKMVDESDHASSTDTRLLKFEEKATVNIFPNPSVDKLTISFPSSWMQESVTAEIFTNNGQLVRRVQLNNHGSQQTIAVNTLPHGSYVLRLIKKGDNTSCNQNFTVL